MMRSTILLTSLLAAVSAVSLEARDDCNPCNPAGATGTSLPDVGSDLKSLYTDLLESVKDIKFQQRRASDLQRKADAFCCRESLDCVTVKNFNVPTCYDKFTTNYAFPDGSYGSLTTGNYTKGGSEVNLLTGTFRTEQGETGDIYADDPAAKPNTATLSIPPQWTAAGVGSAIPPNQIGSIVSVAPSATQVSAQATGASKASASAAAGSGAASVAASSGSESGAAPAPTAARAEGAADRIAFVPAHALLLAAAACAVCAL